MRNFEEEYKNYINEEVPDLWSRIEPQLQDKIVDDKKTDFDNKQHGNDVENTIDTIVDSQEKTINEVANQQKKAKKKSIYIFAKRVLPAVAAVFVLVVGIGVLQTSRYAKNESEMAVATAEEATDEAFFAEVAEEAPDESFADTEVAEEVCESAAEDEFYEEAVGLSIPGQDVVTIKDAVLTGIEVADAEMKENGYVYIYRFTLVDGNKIRVYLTEEQCRSIEESELNVTRKQKYDLDIIPCSDQDKEDELADCILWDIQSAND